MGDKIKILKLIVIIVLIALIIAIIAGHTYYSNLSCHEKGLCKKGEVISIGEGREITVNEVTCSVYKGRWQDKTEECHFKK